MNTRTTSLPLLLALLVVLISGCAGSGGSAPGGSAYGGAGPDAPTSTDHVTLDPDARAACEQVLARTVADATVNLLLVVDLTASTADAGLPNALAEAVVEASLADGSLTVIGVEGGDAPPVILAKDAALSTEGERDRPSVADLASYMPACLEQVVLPKAVPTSAGTDLHRALALASELATAESELHVLTDFVSTTGAFALDASTVGLDVASAAARIAAAAPLDLRGAGVHVYGVGNTSTPVHTATRAWLRELAVALCGGWNARGCEEIEVSPVNAEPRADAAAPDPLPIFPTVVATAAASTCTFEAPASITFAGDSAALAGTAVEVFAEPVALLLRNAVATATIVGHTASSNSYTPDELVTLSEERSAAVFAHFVSEGVSGERLSVVGVGDTQPRAEDIDPATGLQIESVAAAERRVDVVVEGATCSA